MMTICHNCSHTEFLGVECAWPTPSCPEAAAPRRQRFVSWSIKAVAVLSLLVALSQFGQAGYIHAKAWLAQTLISQAWQKTLAGDTQVKPWPWADTWPVARLSVPARGVELYVLAGSQGRSLAFGPGHVFGTAAPGAAGNVATEAVHDRLVALGYDTGLNRDVLARAGAMALAMRTGS